MLRKMLRLQRSIEFTLLKTKSYNVNYSTLDNSLLNDIRSAIASLRVSYDELQKKVYAGEVGNQVDYLTINGKLGLDIFEIQPTFNNLGAIELSVMTSYGNIRTTSTYHAHTMLITQTEKVQEVNTNNDTKCFVLGYERLTSAESAKHVWRTGDSGTAQTRFCEEPANIYPKNMKIEVQLPNFAYAPSTTTRLYDNGKVYFDDVLMNSTIEYAANQNIRLFGNGALDFNFNKLDVLDHTGGGILYYMKIYDKSHNMLADFRPHVLGTNVFLRDISSDIKLHFIGSGYLTYPA